MNNINTSIKKFNKNRYADHSALISKENLMTDKVYLLKIFKEVKRIFNNNKINILEIACSDGSFSKLLLNNGYYVTGVDISEESIKKALENGINAIVGDVEEGLNFPNETFDAVIACEVIEHLFDTDFFIQEMKRVIKKGGYLFISTPNLASLKNRIRLIFGGYPQYSEYNIGKNTAGHIRNYTPKTIILQLKEHDFEIIKLTSPNIIFPMTKNFPRFIKKIALCLGDIFPTIGSHIIVVAKKK